MKFNTALRQRTRRHFERLEQADILVGIPCFNNDSTLSHVIRTVEKGLSLHYHDYRCVVFVADGGSVDDSRETGSELESSPWIERVIAIYRGIPGKGSAVRAIFEAAAMLGAKTTILFDSDLRSISPNWVKNMVDPILNDGVDFVAPYYKRYKYDGTITNNIVYNLTRALYGYRVRQPIGGDFAISLPLVETYLPKEEWETDVGRFGIDIWLSTTAMINKMKMVQANLGIKVHDVKDPAEALGSMFRQVVTTLLLLMEENESLWKKVKSSKSVPIVGPDLNIDPQPFEINTQKLIDDFKIGYRNWKEIWKKIINPTSWKTIEQLTTKNDGEFIFKTECWARILYDMAAAFHHLKGNRILLISMMTPLYFARVASFVNITYNMTDLEAESLVEEQAEIFEQFKGYLIQRWDAKMDLYENI
jgi:glycosyltransferase involved in cell wall biosynthesis